MQSLTRAELVDFLKRRVSLCQYLTGDQLIAMVDGSPVLSYEPHQAVVEFGEDATFLGVLLSGELAASVADGGRHQEIGRFQAGDTFGEMALMSGEKAMSDVIAVTRCQVLRVPVTLFQSMIMTQPQAVQHVSKTITGRFRELTADPAKAAAAFHHGPDPYGLQLHGERPEKILVLNCGSSSLKYRLFDTVDESKCAQGVVERIGLPGTRHVFRGPQGEVVQSLPAGSHGDAIESMHGQLTAAGSGVLRDTSEISAVGHRVVHGGERFVEAVVVTDEILQELEALNPLAPLHNPINIQGIREARRVFPRVPHVATFDTAFHQTLPSFAYLYGLPYEYYEKQAVRRYGFHGMSHWYVSLAAAQFLKRRANELEIVSCHLGNGASVCAVDHGRSVDTSMGFTPCEGLIMGTRSGDVDPGVFAYLERTEGLTAGQIDELLNTKSGLLGISGISGDMRQIEQAAGAGNHRALLALKAFCYRVRKYIGAYVAAMEGLDVLVFTGGIGQGSPGVRSLALQGLPCMGIRLDEQRNREARGLADICRISTDDSPVTVLVIPSNEELMIARETLRAIRRSILAHARETQRQEPVPIEVSAHHVHLTQEHVETLFGPGHTLTPASELSQPGQFASEEQVTLVGPKGRIERVRVLGPVRSATQVEIAMTEQFKLGIHPPIRESGDIKDTPGILLEGPAGTVTLEQGVVCALRHIHMTPEDALRFGVKDKCTVRVRVPGDRELLFGDVLVRVHPNFRLAMHVDTDEANAANIKTGMLGYIDGVQTES